jgi:cell division septation protein DedD
MGVISVLLILGIGYFYLTNHLPLKQSVTQLKIDLTQSRKIIVDQEHSIEELSKKTAQYEITIAILKEEAESKTALIPKETEKPEIKEIVKQANKEEERKPATSISKPHPYVLHIASFRNPKALPSYINLWEKRGYTPFVVLTRVPNKGYWYRFYLNRFESLDQAKRLALKLQEEKLLDNAIPRKLPYALEPLKPDKEIWQRLKEKGYSPYIIDQARILIGAYVARSESEDASKRLADEGFPNRIVKP